MYQPSMVLFIYYVNLQALCVYALTIEFSTVTFSEFFFSGV